jgi:hypothetical protein
LDLKALIFKEEMHVLKAIDINNLMGQLKELDTIKA